MLADRMFRAAMLDPLVFDEIKEDRKSLPQAVQVILIVTVVSIVSSLVQVLNAPVETGLEDFDLTNVAAAGATTIGSWLLWAFLAYLLGTGVFGGTASFMELLRALGFAQAPSVINILAVPLAFIPFAGAVLGGLLGLVASLWTLFVIVVATRQTLGISTGRATIISLVTVVVLVVAYLAVTLALFPEVFELPSQ